jgi:hypothetical protein
LCSSATSVEHCLVDVPADQPAQRFVVGHRVIEDSGQLVARPEDVARTDTV